MRPDAVRSLSTAVGDSVNCCFFFSSRRRHTRFDCDWSSDVCSSDLVVPVFWVAGDDHDFAEANHTWFLNAGGDLVQIVLRERAADAPLVPVAREPCGPEIVAALAQLKDGTPETEFKAGVIEWLERWYRPDATLADAFAGALDAVLGSRGLVVLRPHDAGAKRAAASWVLKGLDLPLADGYTPVVIQARQGPDRLQRDGP